jgi:hypothetical protein
MAGRVGLDSVLEVADRLDEALAGRDDAVVRAAGRIQIAVQIRRVGSVDVALEALQVVALMQPFGAGSSSARSAGSQNRRNRSPISVPGLTRVSSSFSSGVSIVCAVLLGWIDL